MQSATKVWWDVFRGARPSHAIYQGRQYTQKEYEQKIRGLLNDYGCRHDVYPIILGVSEPVYTEQELQNIDPPPFVYEGRRYTAYEAQQQMRKMERAMRKQKNRCIVADASGDDEAFTTASIKLRRQKDIYEDFCKAANSYTQYERTFVGGYDRHLSGRTGAVTRRQRAFENAQLRLTVGGDSGIMRKNVEKIPLSELNLQIKSKKQEQHILGTKAWFSESKRLLAKGENPKSFLYKDVDAQKLVNEYAPKTELHYRSGSKYPIQYVVVEKAIGKTFDKKAGKYIETRKLAIVYSGNGTHVYPVIERE